jgi:phage terminase large subunit GpA-like protein
MSVSEKNVLELMCGVDCFSWLTEKGINLSHGPWTLKGHEYQLAWMQEKFPEQVFIKGAQTGATEALVLRTLHGMIYGMYPKGALYLFPTRDDVKDFSKARFDPLIEANGSIKRYVQNTDSQNIKQIGKGFLIFVEQE